MNHEEIVKEADRISKDELEAWHYVFDLLKRKEREKLNNTKVYECQDTLSWYIDINDCNEFVVYPFGFFFADYINQLNSLKSKETFIAYEKRMRRGVGSEKEINPTFDKMARFFIWNFDENPNYRLDDDISDDELGEIYDNCCWLWKYVKKDVETLIDDLKYHKLNPIPSRIILGIYLYVRRMIVRIWHLQRHSSYFEKHDEFDNKEDESIQEIINENEELINYEYVEKITVLQHRYMGYETITLDDKKEVFCKKYDIPNLLFLVAEDFMHFMLHQTTHNFSICPECCCMFVTTHGNQKHCPACNLIIRQKKRKQNKARYLHKKITDYINNYRSGEIENASELFRNESNYYWAIVQGKKPKKIKEYSAKIETEADYMGWLEKKYEEVKAQK